MQTLLVRITDNDTCGLLSSEWIALADVLAVIEKRPSTDKSFNAQISTLLYKSQIANNGRFFAPAPTLRAENILTPAWRLNPATFEAQHDASSCSAIGARVRKLKTFRLCCLPVAMR
jgi:hypothetical protein